jgi:periplasmic protein TonB
MKPETILRSDWLDILFEHRNKAYGAYALRRHYHEHLMAGIGGMILFSVAICFLWGNNNGRPASQIIPDMYVSDPIFLSPVENIVKPAVPIKPAQPQRSQAAAVNNSNPIIDPNAAQTDVPDQAQLNETDISNTNLIGEPTTGAPGGNGNAVVAAPIEPPAEETAEILNTATVMPQFPGGAAALQKWLSRQLRPQENQTPGERIKVVVRFVVSKTGEIDQISLTQPGGEPYDAEVLRVIRKMPHWIAGEQKGRPVAVWYNIPIIFEMPE